MAKKVILWSRVVLCILMGVCFALNTYAALSPYWSKPEDSGSIEYDGFWASCRGASTDDYSCEANLKIVGVGSDTVFGRAMGLSSAISAFFAFSLMMCLTYQVSNGKPVPKCTFAGSAVFLFGVTSSTLISALAYWKLNKVTLSYQSDTIHMSSGAKVLRTTIGEAFFVACVGGGLTLVVTLIHLLYEMQLIGVLPKQVKTGAENKTFEENDSNDSKKEIASVYV